MKKLAGILAVLSIAGAAGADIMMASTTGSYTQNFNTLISSGSGTWADDSTIDGWYAKRTGTGTSIAADAGSGTSGNLYSYGSASAFDRALGSLGSGNAAAGSFSWGALLQNTTGNTVTNIAVSYIGEQWRNSAAAAQTVAFSYRISATPVTDLTPASDSGWTTVSLLDFISPITGGTAGSLNGNLAANRTSISNSFAVSMDNNHYLTIRWRDIDHTGSDHGLSTDDVVVEWAAIPEPASAGLLLAAGLGFAFRRLRKRG